MAESIDQKTETTETTEKIQESPKYVHLHNYSLIFIIKKDFVK
jgi:hypothetical protein